MNVSLYVLIAVPLGVFILGYLLGSRHTNDLIKVSVIAGFETSQKVFRESLERTLSPSQVQSGLPPDLEDQNKTPMGFDLTTRK